MNLDIVSSLFSNIWNIFIVILFFGGSIFIHELGHFLAARKRGLIIEKFSIGFGPKIFGWVRNGVEYRISLLPLGGYVALPQLGHIEEIEGKVNEKVKGLPPLSFTDKFLVLVMGATFNLIFAFLLSLILWFSGQPSSEENLTTTIGYIQPQINISTGQTTTSPALIAGIQPGDRVLKVDGSSVNTFMDIRKLVVIGSGRTEDGRPSVDFEIERNGEILNLTVYPELVQTNTKSGDFMRIIGIAPSHTLTINSVAQDSPAQKANLQKGDIITQVNGINLYSLNSLIDIINKEPNKEYILTVSRNEKTLQLPIKPEQIAFSKPLTSLSGTSDFEYQIDFLPTSIDVANISPGTKAKETLFSVFEISNPTNSSAISELRIGDILIAANSKPIHSINTFMDAFEGAQTSFNLLIERDDERLNVNLPFKLTPSIKPPLTRSMIGFDIQSNSKTIYVNPFRQFSDVISMTFKVLGSLINSSSDVKISNMMGAPGMARTLHSFSNYDLRLAIWFTVLLNINLAILNLLPIPVLDGGHILFALISKIRGRELPAKVIGSIQGVFMLLLFSLMIYVSFIDVRRWQGDNDSEKRIEQQQDYYIRPEFKKTENN